MSNPTDWKDELRKTAGDPSAYQQEYEQRRLMADGGLCAIGLPPALILDDPEPTAPRTPEQQAAARRLYDEHCDKGAEVPPLRWHKNDLFADLLKDDR